MQSKKIVVSHLVAMIALSAMGGTAMAQVAPDQPAGNPAPSTSPAPAAPTPAAQADENKAMVRLAFSRVDTDKDGKLTPDEAAALPTVAAKFALLDANKDGFISEDEFVSGVRIGN